MFTNRDAEKLSSCIGRLYACHDKNRFDEVVLDAVPRVVEADHATFNLLAPAFPKAVVVGVPQLGDHERRERLFAQYLDEQPVILHYLRTGDPSAHKLSDFLTVREYHRLNIYRELYRDLGYEDQFGLWFFPPGAEMVAIALARDRRNFTERDRRLLNLLRPHLAQAYQQAEEISRLHRLLEGKEADGPARVSTIVLDERFRPVVYRAEARRWIESFFSHRRKGARRLPGDLERWVRQRRERCRGHGVMARRRDGTRLLVRLLPEDENRSLLVLELQTMTESSGTLRKTGLTRREIEVLRQLEQGKTNDEIAVVLGISPFTVRTHLEHIFAKLDVHTRTAAVCRMRELVQG